MQRMPRSPIWQLNMFERLDGGFKAQCRICGKQLKMNNRSVKALITHLNVHSAQKKWFEQLERQKQRGGGEASRKTSTSSSNGVDF